MTVVVHVGEANSIFASDHQRQVSHSANPALKGDWYSRCRMGWRSWMTPNLAKMPLPKTRSFPGQRRKTRNQTNPCHLRVKRAVLLWYSVAIPLPRTFPHNVVRNDLDDPVSCGGGLHEVGQIERVPWAINLPIATMHRKHKSMFSTKKTSFRQANPTSWGAILLPVFRKTIEVPVPSVLILEINPNCWKQLL